MRCSGNVVVTDFSDTVYDDCCCAHSTDSVVETEEIIAFAMEKVVLKAEDFYSYLRKCNSMICPCDGACI